MARGVANSGSSEKYKALKRREFITLLGGVCTTLGAVGVRASEPSAKRACIHPMRMMLWTAPTLRHQGAIGWRT